ncbi:class I SAM-dependent methyltransferase [Marinicellulosiphila megalodicopiae]|uniref:class I SAM-dependent methyltransferase n=1 Tax=Marinicellulosiphila megalodicopiae TaxID=2724896 RepID=UPI003BB0014F
MSFFQQFIRHQETVGSIFPSSRFLADKMISQIPNSPIRVLEVGAGNGVFTQKLLSYCHQDSQIVVSELNPYFCNILNERFSTQIELIQGDILNYNDDNKFDFIVCSLPFNQFPINLIKKIFSHFKSLLKPDGKITFFEYTYMSLIKAKIEYIQFKQNSLFPYRTCKQLEFRNLPPASVHTIALHNTPEIIYA